jgi:hypothetical protein
MTTALVRSSTAGQRASLGKACRIETLIGESGAQGTADIDGVSAFTGDRKGDSSKDGPLHPKSHRSGHLCGRTLPTEKKKKILL